MWTVEIVRARFVEAADTERFLTKPYSVTGKGFWPVHLYDEDDRAGWDEKAKADNASRPSSRAPEGAIDRHAECMAWTSERIPESRRHLVWAFAFCKVQKRDFGRLCQRRGWVKRTAYHRLEVLWEKLANDLNNDLAFLNLPAEIWLAHEQPNQTVITAMMGQVADVPAAIKFRPSFILEKATDLIKTEDDADAFAKFLNQRNALLRKEQARREEMRRRKLGMLETSGSPAA